MTSFLEQLFPLWAVRPNGLLQSESRASSDPSRFDPTGRNEESPDDARMSRRLLWLTLAGLAAMQTFLPAQDASALAGKPHDFRIGTSDFLLDGKPFRIRCGEMHFARVPREYWAQRLQMMKAMGLNAVCVYLFWNLQEWTPGHFDPAVEKDEADFCRLAQKEGLWVLLRPGPYSCAEWDEGGLPWWLLKDDSLRLRSLDPKFLGPAADYLHDVGKTLAPLQVTHGGPILMVQVENEYGSFGDDAVYMNKLGKILRESGFQVPLFACNPVDGLGRGASPGIFQVVNFGSHPEKAFTALRKFQTTGPLMNGEFYPGWYDVWGEAHQHGNLEQYVNDLTYMLKRDISFSIYMAHGGTTWDLWAGADSHFRPDVTSYDYDAPISEAGHVTEKFTRTRALMASYLQPGETLPPIPAAAPVIRIPPFTFTETAPLFANLPPPVSDTQPRTMEKYDQGRGCILYRTTVPAGPASALSAAKIADFAWVFIDGKQVGVLDRRRAKFSLPLPARTKPARLDILVEALGHIKIGSGLYDPKGIHGPVKLGSETLSNWQIYSLPFDPAERAHLHFESKLAMGPTFWRTTFDLKQTGDTFLDLRGWGHGAVWINGHGLGRFWDIGPTQTMYCPAPWLKAGKNEVVILDLVGPRSPVLVGLDQPILGELHPELDFSR